LILYIVFNRKIVDLNKIFISDQSSCALKIKKYLFFKSFY
jgi:hypothetical protein